jgi:hypothetical protein
MTRKYVPDYFSKDFTTLREELIQRIATSSEGKITDLNESSVLVTLIEMFSGMADMLAFYMDQQALETYLPTVRQPRNVYRLAEFIGYTIRETTSARAYLTFSIPSVHTYEVIIPKNTRVATSNASAGGAAGLFYTAEPTVIPIGATESAETLAIQGLQQTENFTMDGTSSQVVSLSPENIDPSTLEIFTGSIKWSAVESFLYSDSDDYHYNVSTTYAGITQITFGDGKYGRLPAIGEQVSITYLVSSGGDGNVGAEALTTVLDSILDSGNNVYSGLQVTNPAVAAGGSAKQDLDQVKATAPGALSGLYRAMTKHDYIALVERIGGVLHANVWGEQEEETPSYENMNWVNIALCPESRGAPALPSENLKETVRQYLDTVQPITVRKRFIDPEFVYFYYDMDIYVEPGYKVEKVRTDVIVALKKYVSLEYVRFGFDVRLSELYKRTAAVDGVAHINIAACFKSTAAGVKLNPTDPDVGDIITSKWQIPVLTTPGITAYLAEEEPSPDLYPYETV